MQLFNHWYLFCKYNIIPGINYLALEIKEHISDILYHNY